MSTNKPQIRSLFPTPLCVHFLPIAQEVNAELRPLILSRMTETGAPIPDRGQGWRSEADFAAWGGDHVQTLFRVVRELADGVTATRGGGRVNLDWQVSATACVRQKGDYQEMRARPGAAWSGIYVVDDGYQKSDDESMGGAFELADPRGPMPAMIAPQYGYRIPGGATAGREEIIRPVSGMFLLYPGWQMRSERLFEGPAQRVTIEFDLTLP